MSESDREGAVRRVGRPGELVVKSTVQAVETLQPFLDDLANRIDVAGDDYETALDEWVEANADSDTLGDMITRPQVMAEMGGQLMASVYETETIKLTRAHGQLWLFQAGEPLPFLQLPFTEAIEQYRTLPIPREKEFLSVLREYSNRSADARKLFLEFIRSRSKAKIIEALEQGRDVRQYIADFQGFLSDLGVSETNPSYLDNVFRTNVATAYGAGRQRMLTDPDVIEERPYVQYRTVQDSRVRPEHAVLDGMIFRADDPAIQEIYPPNGFRCRCSMTSYTLAPGDKVSNAAPAGFVADSGFDKSPSGMVAERMG